MEKNFSHPVPHYFVFFKRKFLNPSNSVGKNHPFAVHRGVSLPLFPTKEGHFEILVQA
jgi:hypothetical protein